MKKQHIAIIRDHSGSMASLVNAARDDYNSNVAAIRENSNQSGIKTYLTAVMCGVGYAASVVTETEMADVTYVQPITTYIADGGGTPLFDSIGRAIEILEKSPDIHDPEVAFLVLAITDGYNNRIIQWNANRLKQKFADLENTGRWTIAFRVPQGRYKEELVRQFGISSDNILEWEATTRGVAEASVHTNSSMQTYYASRSAGKTATKSFFTNLQGVSQAQIKQSLTDISSDLRTFKVLDGMEGARIDSFMVKKTGVPYTRGTGFYELVKSEKVQDTKGVIIRHKHNKGCYTGLQARDLLGLPKLGEVRIRPGMNGEWDIFIQSRSDNRILPVGSEVLYWANAPR